MKLPINLFKEKLSLGKIVLQQKYTDYLKLLSDNELVLRIMAELKEKSSGEEVFEIGYLRLNVEAILSLVKKITNRLNRLSENKYQPLGRVYDNIKSSMNSILSRRKDIPVDELVLMYGDIEKGKLDSVGGKNANIGEIKNRLGLPVPEGFVVTAYAYKKFLEYNQLEKKIQYMLSGLDTNDFKNTVTISKQIQVMVRDAVLEPELEQVIKNKTLLYIKKYGSNVLFSVRSSAVGEGTEFSFAGQYSTFLGVHAHDIPVYYKEIVASKYAPRALFYLTNRGFKEDDIAMSVGCMVMINAKSSGVMHTINPVNPQKNTIVINSIWGLGKYIVEGNIQPDIFEVSKQEHSIIESKTEHKAHMLVMKENDGSTTEDDVPADKMDVPSLTEEQLRELAGCAKILETHYQHPQIVEWAYDKDGKLFILQTSPLIMFKRSMPDIHIDTTKHKLLVSGAETAAAGIGFGPVCFIDTEEDIVHFPNGGIMVARYSSPKFVSVMNRAKAIVTEIGSPTGHMATLAREFQIPAIVNAVNAASVLRNGMMVSVDADHGCIYEGYVEELVRQPHEKKGIFRDTPVLVIMKKILEYITPLNLIDPYSPNFSVGSIRTLHDIIRFAHQASMNEMFIIAQHVSTDNVSAMKLKTPSQFEIYIIDLGGGLKDSKDISESSIVSIPFLAFWKGIKLERIDTRPVNKNGFFSVLMNTMANPQLQERLYEKNLALISKEYMNFNIRMGYHISTIEGLCTQKANDNYIRFIFQGGGADLERRMKRAQLIAGILKKYKFNVKQTEDIVSAICTKCGREKFEIIMDMLGRLTIYTKQLDMLMAGNAAMLDDYVQTFLNEIMQI